MDPTHNLINNFDPISFLGINISSISDEQKSKLTEDLNSRIGQYLLLKLSEDLTEEQVKELESLDGDQIFEKLKTFLPDLDTKVAQALESFKQEYQNERSGGNNG